MGNVNSAKNITIRIYTKEEREILKEVVRETGCKQISKALMKIAASFVRVCKQNKEQIAEIKRLNKENIKYRQFVEQIINASKELEKQS